MSSIRSIFVGCCLCGTLAWVLAHCASRTQGTVAGASTGANVAASRPTGDSPTLLALIDGGTAGFGASVQTRSATRGSDAGTDETLAREQPFVNCPKLNVTPESGVACGEVGCLAFTSDIAAFEHVLGLQPLVLGVGESHAQKGSEHIPSATRRFAESLLPLLCGKAKTIVLEVWVGRSDCGDKRVEQVQKAQKSVTQAQASSNQNEFLALGHVAKRLGIEPSALVPSCDEYQAILDSGPDSVEQMLALVGKKTGDRATLELQRLSNQSTGGLVVAYGGALHNDAEPDSEHAAYSFGPRLLQETKGKYIELDLIVREFIKDTPAWQRQPWFKAWRKNRDTTATLLYQWGKHSFALVFR